VVCGGEIREKPENADEFRKWFGQYSEQPVELMTAVVVINTATKKLYQGTCQAWQLFKRVPKEIVDKLVERKEVFSCCGGLIISDPIIYPYLEKSNSSRDEILGFPKKLILELVKQAIR